MTMSRAVSDAVHRELFNRITFYRRVSRSDAIARNDRDLPYVVHAAARTIDGGYTETLCGRRLFFVVEWDGAPTSENIGCKQCLRRMQP